MPMRTVLGLACTALLASSAIAQPLNPPSEDATGVVLRSTVGEFAGRAPGAAGPVADVRPGETVTITGECVRGPSAESLRVVATMTRMGESSVPWGGLTGRLTAATIREQCPDWPDSAFLLAGPPVPVSVRSSDGTVSFDGTRVRIDWADTSDRVKRATGPRIIALGDLHPRLRRGRALRVGHRLRALSLSAPPGLRARRDELTQVRAG
jgi:hypothetical protein